MRFPFCQFQAGKNRIGTAKGEYNFDKLQFIGFVHKWCDIHLSDAESLYFMLITEVAIMGIYQDCFLFWQAIARVDNLHLLWPDFSKKLSIITYFRRGRIRNIDGYDLMVRFDRADAAAELNAVYPFARQVCQTSYLL